MRFLHAQQVLGLVACISAFAVRDVSLDSTTTVSQDAVQSDEPDVRSQSRQLRPHVESAVDAFHDLPTPSVERNGGLSTLATPTIISVAPGLESSAVIGLPSIHLEKTEEGWGEATDAPSQGRFPPHIEATEGGFGPGPSSSIPPVEWQRVTTPPIVTLPPVVTPPPAITQDGITLQPVPVTRDRVTTIDGKPTTIASAVDFQYVVNSATLPLGTPVMVNNVPIALSVDDAGATVLVVAGKTTTLPPPPAQTPSPPRWPTMYNGVAVTQRVINGTTRYLVSTYTLDPGETVTVGDWVVSIPWPDTTTSSTRRSSSTASGSALGRATTTSARGGSGSVKTVGWLMTQVLGALAFLQPLI